MAVGHVALEGHKTPAALLAFTMCVKRWARTLRGALNKAIKKERFSANTLPHVERLVRALSSVKEITPRSGEGYELNLLHDKLAQEILGAVDSLDSQVIAEIREALIRYLLTGDVGQEGLRFKKLKRHIKEHGAILSEDLLKCMIKDVDSDFEPASLWENVAMLDFVGVARSYVRSMYLCSDSLDLAQDWACL
jgi:hypothetical protein